MEKDYNKFVREAYAVCPDKFCKQYSVKFDRISMTETNILLVSDCYLCGRIISQKIQKKDMIHFAKMYFEGNPIGTKFRRFKLGLFYPELVQTKDSKQAYKKFFLELITELRQTVLNYKGRKMLRPNLGIEIEKYLNDRF